MKTGLVLEAGLLESAFTCGALKYWLDKDVHFQDITAVSVAVPMALYYRAGQKMELESTFAKFFEIHGPISMRLLLKGRNAFDMGKIFNAFCDQMPIDMEAHNQATSALYMGTTAVNNGDAVFWRADHLHEQKAMRHYLNAAIAAPGIADPVPLVEQSYYDGRLVCPLPIKEALSHGCDQLVVVRNKIAGTETRRHLLSVPERLAMRNAEKLRNTVLMRHLHIAEEENLLERLVEEGKAVVIEPSHDFFKIYGPNQSAAAEYYLEGMAKAEAIQSRVEAMLEA